MATIQAGIKCFVVTCNNPVIGQCSGYPGKCGRFYCAEHSSSVLCAECAKRQSADEALAAAHQAEQARQLAEQQALDAVYQDYLNTARSIYFSRAWLLLLLLPVCWAFSAADSSASGRIDVPTFAIMYFGILIVIGWRGIRSTYIKPNQIEKTKPGFKKFYQAWMKNRQQASGKAFLATVLGAAGVAAAIHQQQQQQQLRDDIHQIRKKIDEL